MLKSLETVSLCTLIIWPKGRIRIRTKSLLDRVCTFRTTCFTHISVIFVQYSTVHIKIKVWIFRLWKTTGRLSTKTKTSAVPRKAYRRPRSWRSRPRRGIIIKSWASREPPPKKKLIRQVVFISSHSRPNIIRVMLRHAEACFYFYFSVKSILSLENAVKTAINCSVLIYFRSILELKLDARILVDFCRSMRLCAARTRIFMLNGPLRVPSPPIAASLLLSSSR